MTRDNTDRKRNPSNLSFIAKIIAVSVLFAVIGIYILYIVEESRRRQQFGFEFY